MIALPEISTQNQSDEPLYNIGVVARMTGISMATLRAWERRYSFPEAQRTSGGHRLYSEKDVLRLRWVKDRIVEGMQTAQAVHALHRQEERERENVEVAPVHSGAPARRPSLPEDKAGLLPEYKKRLVEQLIQRQLEKADQVLGEALASSSPEYLILDIISPALADIGEAWEMRRISVATEHFSTNYLRQRLLMWMLNGPPPLSMPPVILACAPNEWHEGSLLVLGALLRRRRIPVAYLGQAVPLIDLATFVREMSPRLVVAVAMTEISAMELVEWPQWIPQAAQSGKPIFGYGGRIFTLQPEWRMRMSGVYLGNTYEEGLDRIEEILK